MSILLSVFSVISACVVIAVSMFAFSPTNSGHIGSEPFLMFLYFIPVLCVSIIDRIKSHKFNRISTFNISLAIIGILLIVVFDLANMIVQYDRWAQRGLPGKGDISWLSQ